MTSPERNANYAVKDTEIILSGPDVRARLMTLAPGQAIPWHYHSEVTDHYFVLKGALAIETMPADAACTLTAGERHRLPAGTAHLISNPGSVDCQFLLLQGVGRYDWIKAETAT